MQKHKSLPPDNYRTNCENPCPGPHSRHVCCVTQQTCLLSDTADMSAVRHSRHVCCGTQQICLLCNTMDMSAVRHSRLCVCECIHACKRGAKREGARLLVGVVDVDPAVTLGSPLSHPWVTLGSTVGQPWVNLGHPRGNGGRFH